MCWRGIASLPLFVIPAKAGIQVYLATQEPEPGLRRDDDAASEAADGDTAGGGDEPLPLAEQIEHAIARSGLRDFYEKDSRGSAESRVENLDELINVASRFARTPDDLEAGLSSLPRSSRTPRSKPAKGRAKRGTTACS